MKKLLFIFVLLFAIEAQAQCTIDVQSVSSPFPALQYEDDCGLSVSVDFFEVNDCKLLPVLSYENLSAAGLVIIPQSLLFVPFVAIFVDAKGNTKYYVKK